MRFRTYLNIRRLGDYVVGFFFAVYPNQWQILIFPSGFLVYKSFVCLHSFLHPKGILMWLSLRDNTKENLFKSSIFSSIYFFISSNPIGINLGTVLYSSLSAILAFIFHTWYSTIFPNHFSFILFNRLFFSFWSEKNKNFHLSWKVSLNIRANFFFFKVIFWFMFNLSNQTQIICTINSRFYLYKPLVFFFFSFYTKANDEYILYFSYVQILLF